MISNSRNRGLNHHDISKLSIIIDMKKQYILLIIGLIGAQSIFAQSSKMRKADNLFDKLSYAYAVTYYQDLIGTKEDTPRLKAKLATCYYNMGNMPTAEKYFAGMIESADATSQDMFLYAQALKQNGKYADSDAWMKKFHSKQAGDMRGNSFASNPTYLQKIEKQGEHFSIKNLASNTKAADFGGYRYINSAASQSSNSIYIVSSRKKRVAVQNEWSWDSGRFLDLFKGVVGNENEIDQLKLIKKKVNTKYHEGPLCFSPDGKKVYFTRNNISKGKSRRDQKGIQNLKMYVATVLQDGSWSKEAEVPFNSKDYSVGHPTISKDGATLYFASDMPGGFGGADIYKVSIAADGTLGTPINLGTQVNTEGQEMFPWINQEGYLFFSSNGHIGLGGLDVFLLTPSKKGGFDKLINAGKPMNSQNDDFAFTMNPDGKTGYFSSNRGGGKGDDDIYSYTLLKPFQVQITVEGLITEKGNANILPGAEVVLADANGNPIAKTVAGPDGKYSFDLEPDKEYKILVQKGDYFDNSATVSTKEIEPGEENIQQNVDLEKDPGLALNCLITDKSTGKPMEGVLVKIIDLTTGAEFINSSTKVSGDVFKGITGKKMGDKLSYKIEISKEGYVAKTVNFTQVVSKPGIVNVHESIDLGMSKPEVGMDLATMIDIKPIYFDLGKADIRKDAALELDKIVKVMKDYPTMVVELGSHTDCRGSIASNTSLSDRRAKASAEYIKKKISNPERIYGKGYGESKLKVNCPCEGKVKSTCPESEHQKNRRTEFLIIKM